MIFKTIPDEIDAFNFIPLFFTGNWKCLKFFVFRYQKCMVKRTGVTVGGNRKQ